MIKWLEYISTEIRESLQKKRMSTVEKELPIALSSRYSLWKSSIGGVPVCFAVASSRTTPLGFDREINAIQKKTGLLTILVSDDINNVDSSRLVERKVNFVIPGKRIYIPSAFIELGGRLPRIAESTITPVAQLTVLYHLQKASLNGMDANMLAQLFGISYLTASRAFKWLGDNLGYTVKQDRKDCLSFPDATVLLEAIKPYLRNPIVKKIQTDCNVDIPGSVVCGEQALEKYTMLASNGMCRAVKKGFDLDMAEDILAFNSLEIWMYDPRLLSSDGICDKISLILSLQDNDDERVQGELEKLKMELGW